MRWNRWTAGCLSVAVIALLVSCDGSKGTDAQGGLNPEGQGAGLCSIQEAISYSEHISGVLEQSCASCHSSSRSGTERHGAPAAVDLDSREGAVRSAPAANRKIKAGEMPPTRALNACEKEAFSGWVESGTPE